LHEIARLRGRAARAGALKGAGAARRAGRAADRIWLPAVVKMVVVAAVVRRAAGVLEPVVAAAST